MFYEHFNFFSFPLNVLFCYPETLVVIKLPEVKILTPNSIDAGRLDALLVSKNGILKSSAH